MVCVLVAVGGMRERLVSGEVWERGMALKSMEVKVLEKWLARTPMAVRVRVIQMRAVGGATALPSWW